MRTILRNENVRGFEIAMDDALEVRIVDRLRNANHEAQAVVRGTLVRFDMPIDGLAFDQFHGEEGLRAIARINRSGSEDLRDPRMLQPGKYLGFVAKP